MLALSLILLYGGGVATGAVVLRHEHLRDTAAFQIGSLAWCVLAGMFVAREMGPGWTHVIAVIPAGLIYSGSIAYFFSTWVLALRDWALGDTKLKVEPTFDQAEAAEKRGDSEGALRLYRAAAQAMPHHAETRRRLGEAWLRAGDADQGIMELRTAMGLTEDPERKMTVAFRVCDLLVEKKGDAFNAGLILQSLEKDHAGTRIEQLARARRERLKPGK